MATVWLQLGAVTSFLTEDKFLYETQAADIAWIVRYLYIIMLGFCYTWMESFQWENSISTCRSRYEATRLYLRYSIFQYECDRCDQYTQQTLNYSKVDDKRGDFNFPQLHLLRFVHTCKLRNFVSLYIYIKWKKTKVRWGPPLLHNTDHIFMVTFWEKMVYM